jgi:hypothetical protein
MDLTKNAAIFNEYKKIQEMTESQLSMKYLIFKTDEV